MLARAHTFTIEGLQTRHVTVEVDIRAGLPGVHDRRPRRRRGTRGARAGADGDTQLGLRVPRSSDHRQPRARRHTQGGPRSGSCPRLRPSRGQRTGPPRAAREPCAVRGAGTRRRGASLPGDAGCRAGDTGRGAGHTGARGHTRPRGEACGERRRGGRGAAEQRRTGPSRRAGGFTAGACRRGRRCAVRSARTRPERGTRPAPHGQGARGGRRGRTQHAS